MLSPFARHVCRIPCRVQDNVACKEALEMLSTCEDSAAIDMTLGQAIKDVWADEAMKRVGCTELLSLFRLVFSSILALCGAAKAKERNNFAWRRTLCTSRTNCAARVREALVRRLA